MTDDGRIAVLIGALADAGAGDALLIEGDRPAPASSLLQRFQGARVSGHLVGCACCALRSPAAEALGRLFLDRLRDGAAYFNRVVAVPATAEGEAALRDALADDLLTRARFRLTVAGRTCG